MRGRRRPPWLLFSRASRLVWRFLSLDPGASRARCGQGTPNKLRLRDRTGTHAKGGRARLSRANWHSPAWADAAHSKSKPEAFPDRLHTAAEYRADRDARAMSSGICGRDRGIRRWAEDQCENG